ncbi:hypothetical protein AD939_00600 [Gluconobacter oxydans]|nr:hypothetical protein AD939_00600 [Gluconobacter oxydans]
MYHHEFFRTRGKCCIRRGLHPLALCMMDNRQTRTKNRSVCRQQRFQCLAISSVIDQIEMPTCEFLQQNTSQSSRQQQ